MAKFNGARRTTFKVTVVTAVLDLLVTLTGKAKTPGSPTDPATSPVLDTVTPDGTPVAAQSKAPVPPEATSWAEKAVRLLVPMMIGATETGETVATTGVGLCVSAGGGAVLGWMGAGSMASVKEVVAEDPTASVTS